MRFDVRRLSHRAKSVVGIIILTVAPTWLAAGQDAHAPSEFELRNQGGVKKNPADLKFEFRTPDARSTFHLYELIPVEMVFTSSRPATYSIAMNEAMSWGAQRYRFEVDPVDAIIVYDTHYRKGIACCSYESLNLSSKPIVLQKELTDFLRFEKAGTYEVFATTERVFRIHRVSRAQQPRASGEETSTPSFTLTSNLLTLTIQPDDPQRDMQRLAEVLRTLHNQKALKDFQRGNDDTTPWFRALRALGVLDTAAAMRERVAIGPLAEDNWPLRMALASTTRPDLMLAALEDRARDSSVALGDRFETAWTKFMIQRDCPEVFRRSGRDPDSVNSHDNFAACRTEAQRKLALFLQSTLPTKTGVAKEITATCIEWLKQGIGCPTGLPK